MTNSIVSTPTLSSLTASALSNLFPPINSIIQYLVLKFSFVELNHAILAEIIDILNSIGVALSTNIQPGQSPFQIYQKLFTLSTTFLSRSEYDTSNKTTS
jgi:hypothetical protein